MHMPHTNTYVEELSNGPDWRVKLFWTSRKYQSQMSKSAASNIKVLCFFFFFWGGVLGIEPRVLCLQGKHSTDWAIPPAPSAMLLYLTKIKNKHFIGTKLFLNLSPIVRNCVLIRQQEVASYSHSRYCWWFSHWNWLLLTHSNVLQL